MVNGHEIEQNIPASVEDIILRLVALRDGNTDPPEHLPVSLYNNILSVLLSSVEGLQEDVKLLKEQHDGA